MEGFPALVLAFIRIQLEASRVILPRYQQNANARTGDARTGRPGDCGGARRHGGDRPGVAVQNGPLPPMTSYYASDVGVTVNYPLAWKVTELADYEVSVVAMRDPDNPTFELSDRQLWEPEFAVPNLQQTSVFLQGYVGEVREFANAKPLGRRCESVAAARL